VPKIIYIYIYTDILNGHTDARHSKNHAQHVASDPQSTNIYYIQTTWDSGKRHTAYRQIKGCECAVRNGVGCNSCCIYVAEIEWGATAVVFM
jgi:hypothetical protein